MFSTYLVHHHNGQQITDGSKEQPVQIMLHILTDLLAESVEDDLTDHEEEDPKRDITQRPAIPLNSITNVRDSLEPDWVMDR